MRPVSATSSTTRRLFARNRREQERLLQPLVDTGVELDVQRRHVLHAEGIGERTGERQPAACEREHRVGAEAVRVDGRRQLADGSAEVVPGHVLAQVARHARTRAEKVREIVPAGPVTAIFTARRFPAAIFGIIHMHEARPEYSSNVI